MSFHPRLSALAFSAMICLPLGTLGTSELQAQSDSARQSAKDPTTLMEDFLHYVRIAKPDLAEAAGNALMDSGVSLARPSSSRMGPAREMPTSL